MSTGQLMYRVQNSYHSVGRLQYICALHVTSAMSNSTDTDRTYAGFGNTWLLFARTATALARGNVGRRIHVLIHVIFKHDPIIRIARTMGLKRVLYLHIESSKLNCMDKTYSIPNDI